MSAILADREGKTEGRERERRLAAVLAADMVGYSRLMEANESGTLARLKTHRLELIDPAIAKNRGRIIKTTADWMGNGLAASAHPAEVIKLEPSFSIATYLATQHYKRTQDRDRHEAGLLKAGLSN